MKSPFTPLAISMLIAVNTPAFAAKEDLTTARTIDMCVEFHDANADRQAILRKELDRRAMLSFKDIDGLPKGEVYKGSTTCGLYMIKGKPLAEHARQLRPMTFKVVHIYPENYYVSQSGIVVDVLERKEGVMPPELSKDAPSVEPPPVMFNAPGGSHHQ